MDPQADLFFQTHSDALGFSVRVSRSQWRRIVEQKHPSMAGREQDIRSVLSNPDQIRRSSRTEDVYLCYKSDGSGRWLCAVVKPSACARRQQHRRLEADGFLITAYVTDAIKEGDRVWPK
jgi:hypothetical protein